MTAFIALLTDFGLQDTYVGQMHAVLATRAPTARVIDLTHAITPQHVLQGALTLADAVDAVPQQSIFLAVVDPGVGSERRAIAAEIGPWRFVGPDNGLCSGLLARWPLLRGVSLENETHRRASVSATFHGRDLFAPAAAALANGVPLDDLGPPLETPPIMLTGWRARLTTGPVGPVLTGTLLWADHFGNVLTSITAADVAAAGIGPSGVVLVDGIESAETAIPLVRCYADAPPGSLIALFGSSGRLELAVVGGSAAVALGPGPLTGRPVRWTARKTP